MEELTLNTKRLFCATVLAAILLISISASAQTKLLRFPDIHGDRVVFTYGGDLWTAAASGGTATRLTAHPGAEVFAKFSPDGQARFRQSVLPVEVFFACCRRN